jgi:threonine dehydratase
LCAFELGESQLPEFHQHLQELGYVWHDVSADPAYRLFLAP